METDPYGERPVSCFTISHRHSIQIQGWVPSSETGIASLEASVSHREKGLYKLTSSGVNYVTNPVKLTLMPLAGEGRERSTTAAEGAIWSS